ncbi:MAG: DUF6152 family protein [Steroidobacteraceae bacterium]
MKYPIRPGAIGAILLALTPVAEVQAHHSVAMFDLSDAARKHLSGTVSKFEWQNPHSWVFVEVANADGTATRYGLELSSPGALRRSGLSYNSIKVGDKVTMEYCPSRVADKLAGLITKITWSDGRSWVPSGQASPLPPSGEKAPGQGSEATSSAPPGQYRPPQ